MVRVAILAALSLWVLLVLTLEHGAQGARMLSAHVQGELPPCLFNWQVPGWDCFTPTPQTPLPPCDFKHQSPGIDCWPNDPPAADVTEYTLSHAAASTDPAQAASRTASQNAHAQQWPELPPCNFPGAMPGWDCFDPPKDDLPPCDFKHQRAGIDCWPKSPPSAKVAGAAISATADGASTAHEQYSTDGAHHVEGMLPPCKDVPGGIPGWDCFDPPTHPLPPCDFKHQRRGFDCWPQASARP